MDSAVSPATRKTYDSGLRSYNNFIREFVLWENGSRLPFPTEQLLLTYVYYCHTSLGISYTTIKSYLSGIRHHFVIGTGRDPLTRSSGIMDRLYLVLRAIKRQQAPRPKTRRPITAPILRDLVRYLGTKSLFGLFTDAMMAAAITMAFFGFLRAGEFCITDTSHSEFLSASDIHWEPDYTGFTIHLQRSKTDPFRQGVDIFITALGPDNILCPVKHMERYMTLRRYSEMPLSGPLFIYDAKALTREKFVVFIRRLLARAGHDPGPFSGHSFRAGAATSCADIDIQDHVIKMLGRWRSDAYQRYVSTSRESITRAQLAMSLA